MLILAALGGCGETPTPTQIDQYSEASLSQQQSTLTGYHFHNWESGHVVFAVGLDGPVCLAADNSLRQPEDGETSVVELLGRISERGRYGHMGDCVYVFAVEEIVEARVATPAESEALRLLVKTFALQGRSSVRGAALDQHRNRSVITD